MSDTTVLSAEKHFESLRESVWVRFCARHAGTDRERFDDLYSEWWTREAERASRGAPSSAAAPAAFVAEAVHRVLIDDVRARARGIGREDKGSLEIVDLDGERDAAGSDDTAATASYEALAHRILTLVRGRLSERELRVFVWSFLYLQPSELTAQALGLSLPRVKKDRKKIAGKVGGEVWAVLAGELDLCAVYNEQSLPAIFEILTVHVEDCPTCAAALAGIRRGALAVLGPELLVVGAATSEHASHALADLFHGLVARVQGLINRGTETLVALPPNGRTAAAVAVAVTTVAGGAATVVPHRKAPEQPERRLAQATPTSRPTAVATVVRVAPTVAPSRATPVATARPERTVRKRPAKARTAATQVPTTAPAPAPAPAEAAQEAISFEQQAPEPQPASAPSAPARAAAAGPAPQKQEFGFEGP